ncbi:MAG: MBG domain-containing protein [Acutalibacteraceae bacterium]
MKILSSRFAAICDKYDSPAPNGSFARRCEAARSSEKNSLTAKIFKYALTAALFLLATAFLIGAAAGYWIIVSRSDVPTSGICSYDSTNLLRYYLADESSDQFGKALNGDLGSASATYDGEFHFPIVSKTPIKKFDGYDKALLPLQFADFNYGGDLTQAYFDDFGYEYVLLTGFSAGAKISPENIKTSAEILKNQSNYTWIAGVPSDAGVYAVRITSLKEVTVVGSSATRSKYGSYIVIYTIAPATATITEAAPLGGSFIVENASSAQSAATMADDSIAGGDGTFIYGVDESGKPLNQGVKVTSLTLGGSSHSVSGYSDISVGSVKNGLNIVLSNNVKSAANHSEADNENFWYTVTASLSGAEAGNYALSNATSLRFRIAPVELNADDIKWYYDGEATNGKTVVYDGSEHGLTASIDETTVSNRYYAKYGNDESVKSAVKSLIDAINGGSAPLTLGVYARSNDNYTAAIPSTAKVAKNAGIYLFSADVYLGGERSTDVYLATEATNTLTINAAQLMVNYGSDPVYEGKAQQPTFTLAGLIGNDGMGVNAKVTQGATVVEPINVGSYTLTLSVSGETYLNYVFGESTLTTETSTSHDYKIIPKHVSLTTSNVSNITYNGVVHAPTATYIDVSGATVNAVTAITKDGTYINANDVKNAGKYALTASLKDTTNYVWADNDTTAVKTYEWTISKLKITVKVTNANQSATYNGAEPTINTDTTVTLTDNGASAPSFVSNELSFSVTKETGVNADNYTLTPSAEPKSGYSVANYDITFTNGTFKINKAALTITANSENITYGDDKPTFSVSYSGFVNNENESVLGGSLVLECDYVKYENVGTYSITPSGLTSGNYAITFESGKLTVRKKQITATISLLSDSIYVTDHVLSVAKPSVAFSGLVSDDTLTVTYTAVNNETTVATPLTDSTTLKKGVYTVNAVFSGDKAGNYDITVTAAKLTVKEYDGTVTKVAVPVANTGLVYNASNQDGIKHNQANYGDYYTVSGTASATNAGDYSVTVTLKDKTSCVWDDNTTDDKTVEWTISKLKITVKVTNANQSATYNGAEPTINTDTTVTLTDNGASAPSFVSNELSFSVTKVAGVNAGNYTLTPSAKAKSGYSVDNYDITPTNGTFKIDELYLKFSGIIEIDYGGSTTLSQDLLRGKLTSTNGTIPTGNAAPSFLSAVARTYDSSNDDNKAYTETKDEKGNITSISGKHGYYKVTLGNKFTVGSTYKVTAELNSGNYAFAVGGNTIIVKYKTAKIGSTYYTIEDALSESVSGNITLVGDSSGSASYIITSFTMLSNTMLSNYNDSKSYTLSGRKLIVPYNANGDERNTFTDSGSFGNVYSALIIPNGVSLNLEKKETNNATLTVAAYVGFNQNISTTLAKEHGVLMNNGNLIVQSGCTINAHGYIKGTGLIELKNGATAVDTLSIYDWPGGTAASEFYKDAFPTNAYTIHNISCKTKIYGGAMYKAKVFVYLKKGIEIKLDEEITVIGNSDKHGMFYTNSTDEDTYVLKSVKAVNDINSNIGSRNQESGASAKNNRDLIAVFGNYFDDSVNISKTFFITISLKTSTSVPLPIGYMDVTVSKGTLSLSASDYMILPGATIKVEKGANLVVGNKVDITAVPYNTVSAYGGGDRNYTAFSSWNNTNKINGRLIINGTLTCESGANIGGLVECEADGATVILKNTTATYKTMYSTKKPYYASGTLSAIGNTVDGENQNLENTTYKSQEVGGNIVWVIANNIKTITFDSCGGTSISSKTIILTNGSFTIPATNEDGSAYLETPSLDYYTFVGWFTAKDGGGQISVGSIVSDHTTLYAHWTPNTYQIVYEWTHSENSEYDFSSADIVCPLDEYKAGETLTLAAPTTTATDLSFVAWYDKDGNQISNITLSNIANLLGDDGKLHILGNWTNKRVVTYTVSIIVGNKDLYNSDFTVDCENEITATEGDYKDFTPIVIDSKGKPLDSSYGTAVTNYNYAKYFEGWYTDESFTSPYTNKINDDTTLYAKWEDKSKLNINFVDSRDSYVIKSTNISVMPTTTLSADFISLVLQEKTPTGYKYSKYTVDGAENCDVSFDDCYVEKTLIAVYNIIINVTYSLNITDPDVTDQPTQPDSIEKTYGEKPDNLMGGFGKDTTYTVTKSETCGGSSETHYYFQGWEFNGTIYVNSEKLSTAIDKYIKDNKDKTEVTLTASWNTKQYDGAIGCTEPINNNFTDAYVMPIFTAIIIAILAYYIAAQKRKGKAKRKM